MATKHLPIFLLNLLEMQLEPQFLPLRALLLQLSFNQMDQVWRGIRGSIWNTGRVCSMLKNFMPNLDQFYFVAKKASNGLDDIFYSI